MNFKSATRKALRSAAVAAAAAGCIVAAALPASAQMNNTAISPRGAYLHSAGVCGGSASRFTVIAQGFEYLKIDTYNERTRVWQYSPWSKAPQNMNYTYKLPIGYAGKAYLVWGADWNGSTYDFVEVQTSFDQILSGNYSTGFC
jgi:hypothetical protein